jgi:hypothetical protein
MSQIEESPGRWSRLPAGAGITAEGTARNRPMQVVVGLMLAAAITGAGASCPTGWGTSTLEPSRCYRAFLPGSQTTWARAVALCYSKGRNATLAQFTSPSSAAGTFNDLGLPLNTHFWMDGVLKYGG